MKFLTYTLIYFLFFPSLHSQPYSTYHFGGLVRADTTAKVIHLAFTGGDYNDGSKVVRKTLRRKRVKAHFFFTGDFYRLPENMRLINKLKRDGHYLGPHSDKHLLYASWENRDSLLVSKAAFTEDLLNNYQAMAAFGIQKEDALLFMPPYEWYNDTISQWAAELGISLVNYTPGTRSNADYTTPDMGKRYLSTDFIYQSILRYESESSNGLNGFILLIHIGTHPARTDKLYDRLGELIEELRGLGYRFGLITPPK